MAMNRKAWALPVVIRKEPIAAEKLDALQKMRGVILIIPKPASLGFPR